MIGSLTIYEMPVCLHLRPGCSFTILNFLFRCASPTTPISLESFRNQTWAHLINCNHIRHLHRSGLGISSHFIRTIWFAWFQPVRTTMGFIQRLGCQRSQVPSCLSSNVGADGMLSNPLGRTHIGSSLRFTGGFGLQPAKLINGRYEVLYN